MAGVAFSGYMFTAQDVMRVGVMIKVDVLPGF